MEVDILISLLEKGELNPCEVVLDSLEEGVLFQCHPLGFLAATIARDGDRSVRVHIWPAERGHRQEPYFGVHSHAFHLSSWILVGEVENVEYELVKDGCDRKLYGVEYDDRGSVMLSLNRTVGINCVGRKRYKSGEGYAMNSGAFHESIVGKCKSALTFVLATIDERGCPLVVGPLSGEERYEYARSVVPRSRVDEILRSVCLGGSAKG